MNENIKFFNLSEVAPRFSKNNFRVYGAIFCQRNKDAMNDVQAVIIAAIMHKSFETVFSKKWIEDRMNMLKMDIQRCSDPTEREILNFEISFYRGVFQ